MAIAFFGVASYLVLLFVIHNFTYRTWLFDGVVGLGVAIGILGWLQGGGAVAAVVAVAIGAAWFTVTRRELAIRGSERLRLRPGDMLPHLELLTTRHEVVTDSDLVAAAPALLILYRGWWCPSHKPQLDEIVASYGRLAEEGVSVFAASVDGPDESQPIQDRVGDRITILCAMSESLLDEIGVKDDRGAPWYDRLIFGAKKQAIAMPAAILIDEDGAIAYAARSTRVDERATPDQILATLSSRT